MPTLAGIQGSSLAGGIDAVEALRSGTAAGEDIRNVRQRGGIDRTIAASATGGTTGGTTPQGALARVQAGGGVDPSAPGFNPIQMLEQTQQQLLQFGAQGAVAAQNMGVLRDQAQARIDASVKREATAVANVAAGLLTLGAEDRSAKIKTMLENSEGSPIILKFADLMRQANTPEEQDMVLGNMIRKATGIQKDIENRQNAQKIAQQETTGQRERKLAVNEDQAQIARDKLNLDIKKDREAPGRANVDVKRQWVADAGTIARENVSTGMELRGIIDQQKRIIGEIQQLSDTSVPLGIRQAIVDKMAVVDPELGAAAKAVLGTPSAKNIDRLKSNSSKIVGGILNQMEKPSDRDLGLAWDQASSVWNQDIDTMTAVLDDMSELVDNRLDVFTQIGRDAVKATGSNSTEADMDKVLNAENDDFERMKFIDSEVDKAQRILRADPSKRAVIEEYFRSEKIDTRYLDYGL